MALDPSRFEQQQFGTVGVEGVVISLKYKNELIDITGLIPYHCRAWFRVIKSDRQESFLGLCVRREMKD